MKCLLEGQGRGVLLEYLCEMPARRPRQRRGAAAASQRVSKKQLSVQLLYKSVFNCPLVLQLTGSSLHAVGSGFF